MQVEVSNLNYSYDNFSVLNDLSFKVEPGSYVALFGKNGIGKSTLLELIMGYSEVNSGRILVNGLNPASDPSELRKELFCLSDKVSFPEHWTLKEAIQFNSKFYPRFKPETRDELIELFEFEPEKPFAGMSAGQNKQAQIIVGLSTNPRLLIIDEMTAYLDISAREKFNSYLAKVNQKQNTTILLSTNIPEDLGKHPTHYLLLGHGQGRYVAANEVTMDEVLGTIANQESSEHE